MTYPFSLHPQFTTPPAAPTVPIGGTRCYWSILSAQLDFIYLDPILHTHLEGESARLIGANLLDFVHPEEVLTFRKDLLDPVGDDGKSGVEFAGVFGSVTTCRYSRVSRIRRLLGCAQPPVPKDADMYSIDQDYLSLKITTSWIGGSNAHPPQSDKPSGAVLVFFHGAVDKGPEDHNQHALTNWTNWCGPAQDMPYLDAWRCEQLHLALAAVIAPPPLDEAGPPAHVFQILDHRGVLLLSFPAVDPNGPLARFYDPEEYANLARGVLSRPRAPLDAITSCTRRYRQKHPFVRNSVLTSVESVVILYGAISFACFQTGGVYLSSPTHHPSTASSTFELEEVVPRDRHPSTDSNGRKRPPSSSSSSTGYENPYGSHENGNGMGNGNGMEPHPSAAYPLIKRQRRPQRTASSPSSPPQPSPQLDPSLPQYHHPLTPQPQPQYQQHPPPPPPPPPSTQHHHHHYVQIVPAPPSHSAATDSNGQGQRNDLSPTVASASAILGSFSYLYDPNQQHQSPAPSSTFQRPLPHPLRQQHDYSSPQQSHGSLAHSGSTMRPLQPLPPPPPPGALAAAAAAAKSKEPHYKPGPKACESCGTPNSPEWRKGPSGTKSLCNACGLRYARSEARKAKALNPEQVEAEAKQKKAAAEARKAKKLLPAPAATSSYSKPSATPPASASPNPPPPPPPTQHAPPPQHHQSNGHMTYYGGDPAGPTYQSPENGYTQYTTYPAVASQVKEGGHSEPRAHDGAQWGWQPQHHQPLPHPPQHHHDPFRIPPPHPENGNHQGGVGENGNGLAGEVGV